MTQLFNDLSNRRSLLANRYVNTMHVLVMLINDRVNSQCRFTGLTVTDDQFTLPTSDRNHGVNDFQACLNWLVNRFTSHNTRSYTFDRTIFLRSQSRAAINRHPQSIDDTPKQFISDWNFDDTSGKPYFIAFFDQTV